MKKSIKLAACLSLLFVFAANAQWKSRKKIKGNGIIVTEKRTTADYDQIKVGGFFDILLVDGKEGNITIEGEENIIPAVVVEVTNHVLTIYPVKNTNFTSRKRLVITVPVEAVSAVSLAGSGSIISKTTIKSDNLSVQLSGSGDINLSLIAKNVKTSLSGSGDIVLTGTTTSYDTSLAGSGDIESDELVAMNVNAALSGSGDISVNCSTDLQATVAGSGDITYSGKPLKKETKVSGSGRISMK